MLFVALCRRYGLKPYRDDGRRYSTLQLRAPETFQKQTLWPEYLALAKELEAHLKELTERVIRGDLGVVGSDAVVADYDGGMGARRSGATEGPFEECPGVLRRVRGRSGRSADV